MHKNFVKSVLLLLGSGIAVSSLYISPLHAQTGGSSDQTAADASGGSSGGSGNVLQQIADNTAGILQQVANLPTYLQTLTEMATQWTTADTSDATANMQSNFTLLGNLLSQNMQTQSALMDQINKDMFGNQDGTKLPNYQDLLYTSILSGSSQSQSGGSKKQSSQNSAYNYIKNAAGLTIPHQLPGAGWQGDVDTQNKYIALFNTTMAAESFDGYVLGNQYADGNQLNTLQATLISQATDSKNWFTAIASENVGWVLRQILLYESQVFVLMTQLIQTQKQMVTAQAITNSLMIINNMPYESAAAAGAQNKRPSGV